MVSFHPFSYIISLSIYLEMTSFFLPSYTTKKKKRDIPGGDVKRFAQHA
jgi:hypothetical protein